MRIIESFNPNISLNESVEKIIVNYILLDFDINSTSNKIPLLINKKDGDREDTKLNLEKGLDLLKKYRYIDDFTSLTYLRDYSYKEKDGPMIKLNSQIEHLVNGHEKTVPYFVYIGNKDKWNFLKKLKLWNEVDLSFSFKKIEQVIRLFESGNKHILKVVNKLSVEYSEYFPKREYLNNDSLQDFLYYFAYKFPKEFKSLRLHNKNAFDKDNYSNLSIKEGIIYDNFGNIVFRLTNTEQNLIGILTDYRKHSGISKDNFKKLMNQTTEAFEQALKELRRKIRESGIENGIIISYDRHEKVYNIFVKE
ncbi:MAG: hypothetical protein PHZ26_04475 [Candidatus Gracilibacteria bacterium]|nr:hypothetical protein [Candidatus Gracilibacteria bacterium]MDD2908984.1 hypothetical protein [Candidatus Gracilibacteria bacterium]